MERESWRLLPYHNGSSAYHFALSDALVRHVTVPTIWWHATESPTLILGAGQASEAVDLEACARAGVRIVKRQAGGASVYASRDVLGLDIALPADHPLVAGDILEAYHWLGEVWVDTTRSLGAKSRLVTIAEARASQQAEHAEVLRLACFGTLSPYEVAVAHKKLVGLAQVRRRSGILLQAGIYLRFSAQELSSLLRTAEPRRVARLLEEAAIGFDEATDRSVNERDVMDAFHRSVRRLVGVELIEGEWSELELERAQAVQRV
jgi:lipoate-protein ligase A